MKERGFTVLELMMVVGIMSILAGMALGFSGNFRRQQLFKEVARNVASGLSQGRAEAVRRSAKIYVGFDNSTVVAFVDANGNYYYDAPEEVIFRYPTYTKDPLDAKMQISSVQLRATNPQNRTTAIFDYQGYSQDYQGLPVYAVICIRDAQLNDTRAVQLTVAGVSRVQAYGAGKALCP